MMDRLTGELHTEAKFQEMMKSIPVASARKEFEKGYQKVLATDAQLKRNPPRVGRNDPCPCGSGKKFKKCCRGQIGI
jgi:uncharacterized protein YecA (UPF0149 family)